MDAIQTDVLDNMQAAIAGKIRQMTNDGKATELTSLLYVRVNDFDRKPNIATLNELTSYVINGYKVVSVLAAEDGLKGIYIRLENL